MKKNVIFRTVFWIVALFLYSPSVFSNGDPVMRYSSLIGSSNPIPREITDIQILHEELYIRPGKYSQVVVRYLLYNGSDKDYTDIDYGFPVDYLGGGKEHENSAPVSDETSESEYVFGWHDDYIRDIAFSLDGKALSWKPSEEAIYQEPPLPNRKNYQADEDGQFWYDLDVSDHWMRITYRRWFYTRFSVKKGEIITLEVKYALRNRSKGPLYDFNAICDNELVYDLSPASHWGDGTARELLVRIDASDIIPGMSITGLPESSLKQDGANYSCQMKDFAFRNAEPIRLGYNVFALGDALELLHHRIPADEYEITAEKESADYPASNLSDLNFSTAWVAPGGGEYSKIRIYFREPTRIAGFALVNGYHKSRSAYLNNNRVSVVDVTIDGGSSGSIYFYQYAASRDRESYYKNNDYEPLHFGNMVGHPDVYYYCVFNREKVRKIELEITGIYPGAKYNDTCLSEIIFFRDIWPGELNKESDADEL